MRASVQLVICFMLLRPVVPCNFTVDRSELRRGLIRRGNYFDSVNHDTDPKATASVEGCAALCCRTEGCRSYSRGRGEGRGARGEGAAPTA